MTKVSPILAITILPSVTSFAPIFWQKTSSSSSAIFGDSVGSDLVDIISLAHQVPPLPLHTLHSPFSSFLKTEDDWKEWHFSFSRNGLTDFLPQFSSHISCLSIDITTTTTGQEPAIAISDAIRESGRLPWQQRRDSNSQATTSITNVPVSTSSSAGNVSLQLQLQNNDQNAIASITKAGENDFDCILDGGILNGMIASLPSTVTWHSRTGPTALLDLVKLMQEANEAIREYGIYVAITDTTIPDYAQGYLNAMGEVMGMEWCYDLDGLSKEGYSVSVARKFFTGALNYDPSSSGTSSNDRNLLKP